MRLPQVFSRAEVCRLFGFTRWPFGDDAALRPVPPPRRPKGGKPTDWYSATAVYAKFRQLFGRVPTPEEVHEALAAVERRRLTALLSHINKKIQTLGAQPNA